MSIASPLTLAHLRAVNVRNLPHSAAVQTAVTTPAAGGREPITSWATRHTSPCRLSLAGAAEREQLVAGSVEAETPYVVAFQAGADVQLGDRLIVTGYTATSAGDVGFSHTLNVIRVGLPDRAGEFLRKVLAI